MSVSPAMYDEAVELVGAAAESGLALRLIGGLAVYARASAEVREQLGRDYVDMDLVAHRRQARQLREWLESRGYLPDKPFNAAHGAQRLMYFAGDETFHIDVFLDVFRMSHTLDFEDCLEIEPLTLPAAELLLSKLQIAELNLKDARDAVMLLADHAPGAGNGPGRLSLPRLRDAVGGDWGLYTTLCDNLGRVEEELPGILPPGALHDRVAERVALVREGLESAPKTRGWRMRAKVGRRVRWYELPDESVEE